MLEATQRPDLTNHKLDKDDFPHLDLTATVRRTSPDGSLVYLPQYHPAWMGNCIGAGEIGACKIIPPVSRENKPAEQPSITTMPYRNVPLII